MKNKITTYSELYDLVEFDTSENKLKQIAEMFLIAMNDWPTFNQTEIADFIKELKEYFGSPLTLERIDNKVLNINNDIDVWKKESGSSIAEVIELSKIFFKETDFDKIVTDFLNYYGNKEIHK
jgi:hypothetical protein